MSLHYNFYHYVVRCEKEPTGELNRDSLINCINEIALNTPDKEEKVKFEPGVKRGKQYVPQYNEEEREAMQKEDDGQVRLDPEMEEALQKATIKDIMELADILNTIEDGAEWPSVTLASCAVFLPKDKAVSQTA